MNVVAIASRPLTLMLMLRQLSEEAGRGLRISSGEGDAVVPWRMGGSRDIGDQAETGGFILM